eukprot:1666562-Pleurochrysis_carterae.AAC.1
MMKTRYTSTRGKGSWDEKFVRRVASVDLSTHRICAGFAPDAFIALKHCSTVQPMSEPEPNWLKKASTVSFKLAPPFA